MADPKKIPQHPLVSRVRPSPTRSEQVTSVLGWPGNAESDDHVRIYLDSGFSTYYELSSEDVVDSVPTDPNDENAPSVVWVRSAARAQLTRSQSVSGDIGFLNGSITRDNLGSAGGGARFASNERYKAESGTWSCPIQTLEGPCETRNIFCPTRATCGPTVESWCTIGSWC